MLAGNVILSDGEYLVVCKDNKNAQTWYLISNCNKQDIMNRFTGQPLQHKYYSTYLELSNQKIGEDYILESIQLLKKSNKVKVYGQGVILRRIIDAVAEANSYSFSPANTIEKSNRIELGEEIVTLKAQDRHIAVDLESRNRLMHKCFIKTSKVYLNLVTVKNNISLDCNLVEVEGEIKRQVQISNVSSATMDDLRNLLDLSFYETTDGRKLKDYGTIKTIEEFETNVMQEIYLEYKRCVAEGRELELKVDTETDGLMVNYLNDANTDKSFIVATPISWRDNQARVVFNEMEYFDNVPKEYMFARLKPLVEGKDGIVYIPKKGTEVKYVNKMDLFNDNDVSSLNKDDYYIFDRSKINLIGHNVMFDGKVFFDNGVKPYWNNDTLQMSFNLNPSSVKKNGGNKLKSITRRLFGHETPELTDLLGKNNEDKYKYIKDEEVASLYGCADADYTGKVYRALRKLTTEQMFKAYQEQDVPLLNVLYMSEYYGLLMDADAVKEMAKHAENDLELIRKFLYHYVGGIVSLKDKRIKLKTKYSFGELTEEEFKKQYAELKADKNAIYTFKLKASDIIKVLYDILEYPILARTSDGPKSKPSTDKKVFKKLMRYKVNTTALSHDIMDSTGKHPLIEAKEFNKYKYPLAYVLTQYAKLNKEYTSYFKPILTKNCENRIFNGYSMARIETRRIMNASQTMKSSLKDLVLPFDGGKDYYMFGFDMAQVEYRIMVSLAGQTEMIERLKDPEKDFHTESASALTGIPAHQIEKDFRKQMKAVHFGIPYGLGDDSMAESMFGSKDPISLYKTRDLIKSFKTKNDKVIAMLEEARDNALKPRDFSLTFKRYTGFREFINQDGETVKNPHNFDNILDALENKAETKIVGGAKVTEVFKDVGLVQNLKGFYRLFDLSNLDKGKIGVIRRAAGNYPIQSFAAELFRIILIRFYNRCVKEGIDDKIIWHMLIHDEIQCSAHKSIHPFFLYKIILEECMITFPGHTNYFVGIGIGNNWGETKSDKYEAPVEFVKRMVKRWEAGEFKNETWIDDPKNYVMKYMLIYFKERIGEVLKEMQPNIETEPIDLTYLDKNFENYTVRSYLIDRYVPAEYSSEEGKKKWKSFDDRTHFKLCMEKWATSYFGEDKLLKDYDGKVYKPSASGEITSLELLDIEDDIDTSFNNVEENWVFDEEGMADYSEILYFEDFEFDDYDDNSFQYDLTRKDAKNVSDLVITKESPTPHIVKGLTNITISCPNATVVEKVKLALKSKIISAGGLPVIFNVGGRNSVWLRLPDTADAVELNDIVQTHIDAYNRLQERNQQMINNLKHRVNHTPTPPTTKQKVETVKPSALIVPEGLRYIKVIGKQIIITIPSKVFIKELTGRLMPSYDTKGNYSIIVKCPTGVLGTLKVNASIDLNKIEQYISEVS